MITIYVVAGVFELAGIVLVVLDLRDVRERLRSYKTSPKVVHLRAAEVTATVFPGPCTGVPALASGDLAPEAALTTHAEVFGAVATQFPAGSATWTMWFGLGGRSGR